eukprot:gene7861-36659_t
MASRHAALLAAAAVRLLLWADPATANCVDDPHYVDSNGHNCALWAALAARGITSG